jgi:hypothetical protein
MRRQAGNRYADEVEDDGLEDADWDAWMAMSDVQIDRELAVSAKRYNEFLESMTPDQLYRYRRRGTLRSCMGSRLLMREHGFGFYREYLRQAQIRLVRLRAERHGKQTGSA